MPQLPAIWQSYTAKSLPLDAQQCVNFYAEAAPDDAEARLVAFGSPGVRPAWAVGAGPIQGMHVMRDVLFVVSGQELYSISTQGQVSLLGLFGVAGRCVMADNGEQLIAVDGQAGWIYQFGGVNFQTVGNAAAGTATLVFSSTGSMSVGDPLAITLDNATIFNTTISAIASGTTVTLAAALPSSCSAGAQVQDSNVLTERINNPAFYPAGTVTYFDDYFVFSYNGTQVFFISAIGDGTQYSGGDFASKEGASDTIMAVIAMHEQLYLFGRRTTEVWYDAGALDFPFQRYDGAFVERGIASPQALAIQDNTLFWLGDDLVFYRLNGFSPFRVSTHATETAWHRYPTTSDAFCFTFTYEGHKFLVLTFPTAQATWVFDVATALWHQRESWVGTDTSLGLWRAQTVVHWNGYLVVGDMYGNGVGILDGETFTEWGNPIRGLLTTAPFHDDRRRIFMSRFELLVESGVGLTPGSSALQYTAVPIEMTAPSGIATAGGLANMAYEGNALLVSLWAYLPDDGTPQGFVFGNALSASEGPGLWIAVANDQTAPNDEISLALWDANGNPIVAARWTPTSWSSWVNLIFSIDTATQQLQLYANGVPLTASSLAWSSRAALPNPAGQPWILRPGANGEAGGVIANPDFLGKTTGAGTVWVNTSNSLDAFGNAILSSGGNIQAVSETGAIVWTLTGSTIGANILAATAAPNPGTPPGSDMTATVICGGAYLAVTAQFTTGSGLGAGVAVTLAVYGLSASAPPSFVGAAFFYTFIAYPSVGGNRPLVANAQTTSDPILVLFSLGNAVGAQYIFPTVEQFLSGGLLNKGILGLYPNLNNTASWFEWSSTWVNGQVPAISYGYPASLGTNFPLVQYSYNPFAGFVLEDGEGGTNYYIYFSRGDMAANLSGVSPNPEIQNVLGPAYPDGAMLKIALGVLDYDTIINDNFANNSNSSYSTTMPMYTVDNANWQLGNGAPAIPFPDEYVYATTGAPGGSDVYSPQPSVAPPTIVGGPWIVAFTKVGISDSATNRSSASILDTVRAFSFDAATGIATQLGGAVTGEVYTSAADWGGDNVVTGDKDVVSYLLPNGTVMLAGAIYASTGIVTPPNGAVYFAEFGTWSLIETTVADFFMGTPASFYDLSVPDNLAAFISGAGGTQYLGPNGSAPLGAQPPLFLTLVQGQPADAFAANVGFGGPFAVTGSISLPAIAPPPSGSYPSLEAPTNTPQGADPQIMLDWSDDGARTWSTLQKWRSMGKEGEYRQRLRWLRMGQARTRTIRLQITDPVRRNILGAYVDATPGMP